MSSELKNTLEIAKILPKGDLHYSYLALQNLLSSETLGDFKTILLNNPTNISLDILTSYDGSADLVINSQDVIKIVNSGFALSENGKYEYITRNQKNATNIYDESNLDIETDLFITSTVWPKIILKDVTEGGQLPGGNYTFYIRYADEDDNESDFVSESGCVSVFHGSHPTNIHGTLADELTNKTILLQITNLEGYPKYYLYFTRNTSDLNGISVEKFYKVSNPYRCDQTSITLTTLSNCEEVSPELLDVVYNYYNGARTQCLVQNRLFLGNINIETPSNKLRNLSYYINVTCKQDRNIGYVNDNYTINAEYTRHFWEYYSPKNIYNYVGYWPNEYYRLGIVYLFSNGSKSQVYNLRGKLFDNLNTSNIINDIDVFNELEADAILNDSTNTYGVFKMPDVNIYDHDNFETKPLYLQISISDSLIKELKKCGVIGYFFVRQQRMPISIAQGLSIGVDQNAHIPMLYIPSQQKYIAESFIGPNGELNSEFNEMYSQHIRSVSQANSGLLCLDATVNKNIQNLMTYSEFNLEKNYKCNIYNSDRHYVCGDYTNSSGSISSNLLYIPTDTPIMRVKDYSFSTRSGSAESANGYGMLGEENISIQNRNIVRGVYAPFIGVDENIDKSCIFTIKLNSLGDQQNIETRGYDKSAFYSISDRYSLDDVTIHDIYRGDCFTNTVTVRMNRNFVDPNAPYNNRIVTNKTWDEMLTGEDAADISQVNWNDVNVGDLNAINLGTWITYKCLSNYNLGLRSLNKQNLQLSEFGSFYPISSMSTKSNSKVDDSELLNEGYSRSLPRKNYNYQQIAPFQMNTFSNRIAFSNVNTTKLFNSGIRVFQGLSYQDIDNSFGAIVKLLPYGQNLFCVFEHGCAIVPVNEKALLSTQEGQSIHLYGAGVLQEQVSVISPDFGSIWQDSIIKTPDAYYGVDTYARKIWKFNNEGFQVISDQKINSFLNDNINLSEQDKYPTIAYTNVKTHYNNYKGDVMFTFYHDDKCWNLCYNERMKVWTTQYSWTPLISANIDNTYYSMDKEGFDAISNSIQNTVMTYNKRGGNNFYFKVNDNDIIDYTYNTDLQDIYVEMKSIKMPNINDESPSPTTFTNVSIIKHNDVKYFPYLENDVFYWYDYINKNRYIVLSHRTRYKLIKYDYNGVYSDEILIDSNIQWIKVEAAYTISHSYVDSQHQEIESGSLPFISVFVVNECTQRSKDGVPVKGELTILQSHPIKPTILELLIKCGDKYMFIDKIKLYSERGISNDNRFIYKHGQAGIFNNTTLEGEVMPTKWYNIQHPFEFEFVVNKPIGLHKIFDNLVIISNNVQPESLEIEIEGDVYDFIKENIVEKSVTKFKKIELNLKNSDKFTYETTLVKDRVTNKHKLKIHQDCINVKQYGRRLGNIQYLEDSWRMVIQPIYYTEHGVTKSTRVRDKYAKIRIKYSGTDLVTINAIHTLMTSSYV